MDLYLAGKTAVVTGASKGIGFAVTTALVAAGAHVVAGSRTGARDWQRCRRPATCRSYRLTCPGPMPPRN